MKIEFGKHKGKEFEDIIRIDGKWFCWMYFEIQDSKVINYKLLAIIKDYMVKNGCTLFDGSDGMRYCHSCKKLHYTLKKKKGMK